MVLDTHMYTSCATNTHPERRRQEQLMVENQSLESS